MCIDNIYLGIQKQYITKNIPRSVYVRWPNIIIPSIKVTKYNHSKYSNE